MKNGWIEKDSINRSTQKLQYNVPVQPSLKMLTLSALLHCQGTVPSQLVNYSQFRSITFNFNKLMLPVVG